MKVPTPKPVLLVVDMQNDFIEDGGFFAEQQGKPPSSAGKTRLIESCKALTDHAHETGAPVIYARVSLRSDRLDSALSIPGEAAYIGRPFLVEGSWGSQIVDELTPLPNDLLVTKKGNSAFAFTHLDRLLKNMGANTLVVVGGTVFGSINATLRDASASGYTSYVVPDATYSMGDTPCELLAARSELVSVADAKKVLAVAADQSYAYAPTMDWQKRVGDSCLLMIDLQKDFITPGGALAGPPELFDETGHAAMLAKNVELMEWARAEAVPVICVRTVNRADQADSATSRMVRKLFGLPADTALNAEDTWGVQFAEGVAPKAEAGDIELVKKGHGAFTFTHLNRMLTNLGATQCLVSGGAIGGCIEETILEGCAQGYAMVAVTDACYRPGDRRMQLLAQSINLVNTDDVVSASVHVRRQRGDRDNTV